MIPLLDRYVDIYPSEIIAKLPTITCPKTGPKCPTSLGKQTVVCTFVIFIQMNSTQQWKGISYKYAEEHEWISGALN